MPLALEKTPTLDGKKDFQMDLVTLHSYVKWHVVSKCIMQKGQKRLVTIHFLKILQVVRMISFIILQLAALALVNLSKFQT